MEHEMNGIFPIPVYIVKRDTNLSPKEAKEIRKIIKKIRCSYSNYLERC